MNDYESLNHTKWECKYHVVFIPKYRRKALYGSLRKHLGNVFRELARQKECEIGEGHLMVDHVHMLISIPPKYSVSQVLGYIKGKSAIHIARTYAGKRRNFVGQHFWARGYWVSTVGHNEAGVRKYIQEQEKEDQRLEQLGLFAGASRFERFTISSLRLCRRSLTSDGKQLVSSQVHPSLQRGFLKLWRRTDGSSKDLGMGDGWNAQFSSDGRWILSGSASIRDSESGEILDRLRLDALNYGLATSSSRFGGRRHRHGWAPPSRSRGAGERYRHSWPNLSRNVVLSGEDSESPFTK